MSNPTQEEINKYITEAMCECWHEWEIQHTSECNIRHGRCYANNNFFTWEGFGALWEWSQKQKWWTQFILDKVQPYCMDEFVFTYGIINPELLATTLYNFLKERDK